MNEKDKDDTNRKTKDKPPAAGTEYPPEPTAGADDEQAPDISTDWETEGYNWARSL